MTQQASSETLDQLCERYPAVKALREENERLQMAEHALQRAIYDDSNEYLSRIADLESQLAELRQGGEADRSGPYSANELREMLFDVVNELDLSDSMIDKHGPLGTAPAVLVREVLEQKDLTISLLRRGFKEVGAPQPAIPPGYAVPEGWDDKILDAMAGAFLNQQHSPSRVFDGDLVGLRNNDTQLGVEFAIDQLKAMLASAPAIQPQAAAPSVPVAEKDSDTARLDFLDAMNTRKNQQNNSKYGWRLSENHNRIALEDHNFPSKTVREAIDEVMRAAKNTEQ